MISCAACVAPCVLWEKAVEQINLLLRQLRAYPEGQVRHAILRFCLDGCRVVHLLRSTEHEEAEKYPAILRARLQEAVQDLLGMGIGESTWDQVCLPIRLGGLGISDPHVMQPSARVAALLNLSIHGTSAVGVPREALLVEAPDLQVTLGRLQSQVGPHQEPLASWLAGTLAISSATEQHATQRWWRRKSPRLKACGSSPPGRQGTE